MLMHRHGIHRGLRLWLLTAGLLSLQLAIQPVSFALETSDVTRMTRIDFDASAGTTELTVFADNMVPFHKSLFSDDKLIIDFDHVASNQQIETHFNNAENISHVVVQPLSEDRIRLIIRGEHLAPANITFHDNPREEQAPVKSAFENGVSSGNSDVTPSVHQAPKPVNEDSLNSPLSSPMRADIPNRKLKHHDASLEDLAALGGKFDLMAIAQYGLLGGLFIFLTLFIRHKITEITRQQQQIEDDEYLEESQPAEEETVEARPGKRGGFAALAQAYRQNKGQVLPAEPETTLPKPGKKQSKPDSLIGLRGLSQSQDELQSEISEEAPALPTPPVEEQIQEQPRQNQPASRQVVNQYLKQQHPTIDRSQKRKATDDALRQELRRTTELSRFPELNRPAPKPQAPAPEQPTRRPAPQPARPAARQTPAQAKPNIPSAGARNQEALANRGPLPGNPAVLNFLRDVADLMEKDGQHHLAKSINKSLK